MKLLFGIILGGLLYLAYDKGYVDEFLSEFNLGSIDDFLSEVKLGNTEIADMNCYDISSIAKGKELKNIIGGKFKIIKVKDVVQIAKTRTNLICSGQAMLDNAQTFKIKMKVFKDEDGDVFYQFEQIM